MVLIYVHSILHCRLLQFS